MSSVASAAGLPMFYQALERLDPKLHLGLGVRNGSDFQHVRHSNAIPLGCSEFVYAVVNFPIVFAPAVAGSIPIAVTGIREGDNLFVDESGQWEKDAYVPGYLRRYPFWMRVEEDGKNASVWFDPKSGYVVPLKDDPLARPLFSFEGAANDALLEIGQFCHRSMQDEYATAQFVAALEKENLLVERQANMSFATGGNYELKGFRVVDEQAYLRLPDATLASWVRNGWAALISIHLWSMASNWSLLLARHDAAVRKSQAAQSANSATQTTA